MNYWLESFLNEPTEEGKFQIIWKVAHLEMHNSVSKEALLEMLRFMADYMLEEVPEEGSEQKPIPPSEIFQQSYQVPCWLERRNEDRISPEVLDRDSVGYFGKIESRIWIDYKKMKPEEYGKTWRCWRTRPTNEELEAAEWEE